MNTKNNRQYCKEDSVRIEGISKRFGKVQALDNINLVVEPNSVFALLGPNGSGKTTLVRILTTLLMADSGKALVGGFDVEGMSQKVRSVIGLAGQYPAVDDSLTGRENLEIIGQLYHLGGKESRARASDLLEQFGLSDAAGTRARFYSGGMRRRLDLAATLIAKPLILFLDEPTTGLDPRSRLALWEVIAGQAKDCNTVFLTTQYLEEADRLAHKVAIIDEGKIIRQGTPGELKTCCGGESRVSLTLYDRKKTQAASDALNDLAPGKILSSPDTGNISLPADAGSGLLSEVVRRMDAAGIILVDLSLKQPTLDDVFLAITGRTAERVSQADTAKISAGSEVSK